MNFVFLDKQRCGELLPVLFDILYENMRDIAPSGLSYEQERSEWLAEVAPAIQKAPRQIVLIKDGGELAGYCQYYVNNSLLMVEEIQLKTRYQRTRALYGLCLFLKAAVPTDTSWIEAYADRRNTGSQKLMHSLGMACVGQSHGGKLLHFRGEIKTLADKIQSNKKNT